jgi:hypothetical protein
MMSEREESYLGDGLYASFDGFMFTLRAPREDGDHWVALEPQVMEAFLAFVIEKQGKKDLRIEMRYE